MAKAEANARDATTAKAKSRLVLVAAVGLVVLVAGGLGGAWALGVFAGTAATAAADDAAAGAADARDGNGGGRDDAAATAVPIFVDLPQLLVNLASEGGGTRFLKLALAVEVADPRTAERIEQLTPRIVDSFQLYLRTLTAEELRGPGSMFRLKEDLHVRIHQAIEPARVRDVLFKEMLVQ